MQRFLCKACHHTFSTQTFRFDYRHRRPQLTREIFLALVSKLTLRQTARVRRCNLKTVAARLHRLGRHCRLYHEQVLAAARARASWRGAFVLDELETFEHHRLEKPLTVPLIVHQKSCFVIHTAVGTLPARGRACGDRATRRGSQSKAVVQQCLSRLARVIPRRETVFLCTDKKPSYRSLIAKAFRGSVAHKRISAREERNWSNPLFAVNHTFAMLRDGLSRLVRRNWATTKKSARLIDHLWIWIAWRNYVRPITNKDRVHTPAMVVGLQSKKLGVSELLSDRLFGQLAPSRSHR